MTIKYDGVWVCTEEDLKARLNPLERKKFNTWFSGQTGIILPSGELGYFLHDIDRFIKLYRHGKPTYWD